MVDLDVTDSRGQGSGLSWLSLLDLACGYAAGVEVGDYCSSQPNDVGLKEAVVTDPPICLSESNHGAEAL